MTDRTVAVGLRANVTGFVAGIKAAETQFRTFLGELDKSEKKKQALSDLGSVAGKIGLVAGAGLGAAVMSAANFDEAMSKVSATGDDARGSLDKLRQAAIDAGADTAFSAVEAAEGIENLAKAGVSASDTLSGGLSGALDLAAAGEMEVAEAAEAAAGAMAQFGLSGKDVPHIADLLAAAAGKAQGEVSDMVYALKQGGLVAAQTGLSIEETTGTLAAFAESSLLGSDAGTSFKTMLASLTPNTGKAAAAMEQYNINAFDAQGNFVGMVEFARQLEEGLGDLSAEQRMATMETIFGSDAVRAASIVYEQGGEGIEQWITQTNDAGYAAETAAEKLNNLKGDLEELKGSLETALIGTGEGSQGPLRALVQGMTDAVNAFNDLPPAAKDVTAGLLGIVAVTGGAAWFGTKVIGGIVGAKAALSELNLTGAKSSRMLAGIGKAAGAVGAVLATLELTRDIYHDTDAEMRRFIETASALGGDTTQRQIAALTAEMEKQAAIAESAVDWDLGPVRLFPYDFDGDAVRAADRAEALKEQIAELKHQANLASIEGQGTAESVADIGKSAFEATEEVDDFAKSLKAFQAVLSGRADMRAYEASLDEAAAFFVERKTLVAEIRKAEQDVASASTASERESARERLADLRKELKGLAVTLDITTEAGRANQERLDGIASVALEVAEGLNEIDRAKHLRKARRDFIDAATDLGLTRKQAQGLADDLGLLAETKANPKVILRADKAKRDLDDLILGVLGLDGKTFGFNVVADVSNAALENFGGGILNTPSRKRRARGGPVTGGETYLVGEEGPELFTAPRTGYITNHQQAMSGGIDYGRLAAAMEQARPLYGPVTLQPHDYNEFRREMTADRRRATDGVTR